MIRRAQYVSFRLTEKENQKIREKAASLHLTFSEFVRRRAFEKQIVPTSDLQRLEEIRRLGRLLKQTFLETRGIYSQGVVNAINGIVWQVATRRGHPTRQPVFGWMVPFRFFAPCGTETKNREWGPFSH